MYRKLVRYSSKHFNLFKKIVSITDGRLKPQIAAVKITTAIIIMQFSNLGSLNSLSQAISVKNLKKDIPSVSTIARSADSMDLEEIRNIGIEIYLKARKSKMLSPYCGMWVGIVDGHEQTTSKYRRCPHCKSRIVTKKGGVKEVQYYHEFTAFILAGLDISFHTRQRANTSR